MQITGLGGKRAVYLKTEGFSRFYAKLSFKMHVLYFAEPNLLNLNEYKNNLVDFESQRNIIRIRIIDKL